jgi:hypothetical protein
MRKLLKLAAVVAAMTMFVSAAAEAQGGGGGGGGVGARGGGQGRGGRGGVNRFIAEGVSADSAYTMFMANITVDATKKPAILALVTKFQTDMRATPAPARAGRGGGAVQLSAADSAALAKRTEIQNTFRTEVKKHLTTEQATQFDMNFPMGGRRGGGGGGR